MAAGVGKTYAMLADALIEKNKGIDVVAGYIEPHGRPDTAILAEKFETIPFKETIHQGLNLKEFDLDAALKRKPKILLVDELAHQNPPNFRHQKRWQDIDELLSNEIDVYATVNIQHLESLNDIVAKITGVTVTETVPDAFFAKSDALELVDIPPEELIERFKEGKVYPVTRVETALKNFFTTSNLTALRELVLRQLADRVDAQMLKLRDENLIGEIWAVKQKILVCVGPNRFAKRLIRVAQRIATNSKGELIVLTIERINKPPPGETDQQYLSKALQFAQRIGAETVVRSGNDLVAEVMKFAKERNTTLIVVGKPLRSKWHEFVFSSLASELIRKSGTIPVQVISVDNERFEEERYKEKLAKSGQLRFISTLAACAGTTAICSLLFPFSNLANIIMVYLLMVVWAASRFGRREAIIATVLSVASFDYFFVPPYYQFAVADVQYVLTFAVMLVIGLLIAHLTSQVRYQAEAVTDRERRTALLYELSRGLLATGKLRELGALVRGRLGEMLGREVSLVTSTENTPVTPAPSASGFESEANEQAVISWVIEKGEAAGAGTDTLSGSVGLYLPVMSSEGCLGALAINLRDIKERPLTLDQRSLLEACADQIALGLIRLKFEDESSQAKVEVEKERLRNIILSAVSHDLRTPLTAIHGAASVITDGSDLSVNECKELASTIAQESDRLSRMVRNILDMTKIEQRDLKLSIEWNSIEELIGSALSRTEVLLKNHKINFNIPEGTPLVRCDAVLIEQVFVNLLENASKHTPSGTKIDISTTNGGLQKDRLIVSISDNGPGIDEGLEDQIFEKLFRGKTASPSGFGLGLSICRTIMRAHGGDIIAKRGSARGLTFDLIFKLEQTQPEVINE